ncbi:MAG: phosphoenolpyruvate synthase, partial [Kiritimatiellae bacterium]|nr:phosphoenolpyruvate synthase [Kiritimatiellia bacterium]
MTPRGIRDHNDPLDTSGLPAFDAAVGGILAGDNIVWHVACIEDYSAFVLPFVQAALRDRRRLIYFRFARHAPLLPETFPCERHTLNPEEGFEVFIHRIHQVIGEAGFGAYYVFDCLSDLATDWYSDAMLGNFFMLTCPYLYRLETIAYFGLLRRRHSRHATEPVQSTTQLFLDVFRSDGALYVRPVKTQFRYTPTIHLLHVWKDGGAFEVVRSSAVIAAVLSNAGPDWVADDIYGEETLRQAEDMAAHPESVGLVYTEAEREEVWRQLARRFVTRDDAILPLARRYLTLADLLDIRARMVGTGLIGGKTVGMLLARKIAAHDAARVSARLEPHDSFYIGADVFYTFLVRNGLWPNREKQHASDTFLEGVDEARARIMAGTFPDYV